MKNKGFIITLTVTITVLCVYYLSFTFVSRGIQQDATENATDVDGNLDFYKKQAYLDSVWNEPVYNLLGMEYTYKEVKDTELSLGLDLQGGMHVTLEVSPVDIIKGLSGNSENPEFLLALQPVLPIF
jgi:SecD/SecF fusion protein